MVNQIFQVPIIDHSLAGLVSSSFKPLQVHLNLVEFVEACCVLQSLAGLILALSHLFLFVTTRVP